MRLRSGPDPHFALRVVVGHAQAEDGVCQLGDARSFPGPCQYGASAHQSA